jgi:hypothetical protein
VSHPVLKIFKLSRVESLLAALIFFFAPMARAQSFLFPGASTTYESGLSQTNSRGAVAVANNPANTLITKKYEAYADMTILNVNYTYTRPDYAPAKIALTAPPVNFGFSLKPSSKFALGLFFTPRPGGSQAQKIQNVPMSTGADVLMLDLELRSTSFITAIGAGFKVNKALALGLSIIESAEDTQVIARQSGTTDDDGVLAGMRYRGVFMQVLAGFRAAMSKDTVVAGSYRTAVAKSYRGTQIVKGDQDNNIAKKGYSPGILAVGGERKFGAPAVFSEIQYVQWSGGRTSNNSGLPGGTTTSALNDVINLIVGGRLKIPGGHSGSASLGIYPHNVALGSKTDEISGGDGASGVGFGDFDALDRMMFSGSYRYSGKKRNITAGFNFISGNRTVPSGYPNDGKYSLSVFSVGAGASFYF